MATLSAPTLPTSIRPSIRRRVARSRRLPTALLVAAGACAAVLVHGFHPFAEDGGLYAAGVEYTLDPRLFPLDRAFVTAHLRWSAFAPLTAALVRGLHLPLPAALFAIYIAGMALLLYAGLRIARAAGGSAAEQAGAVALLTAWATLPVAGTSLLLMDPYSTARTLSTPLGLLALACTMEACSDRQAGARQHGAHQAGAHQHGAHQLRPRQRVALHVFEAAGWLLLATVCHPLMALYAAVVCCAIAGSRYRPWLSLPLLGCAVLSIAGAALALSLASSPPETPAYLAAVHSRYYWFLSGMRWYELAGLFAPLLLLAGFATHARGAHERWKRGRWQADGWLSGVVFAGALALVVSGLFCREALASHVVARLQPLRVFVYVYAVMIVQLGMWGARRVPRLPLIAAFLALSAVTLVAQRRTFPHSAHIEWPGAVSTNGWVQAFVWVERHSGTGARIALDARYIQAQGEDAQGARAWSRRNVVPDFSKDGGEASISPQAAAAWLAGASSQANLDNEPDARRVAHLAAYHPEWLVLAAGAHTSFPCPYTNATAKVCRFDPKARP